ncbi:MFS transporter [Sphingobium sp. CR2-8]|uniref:MFS transporter n=1 Tax=Sphingobium sp. CR2-8 TaxID=1306534 RepID=UPI002DBF2470|nr:MFS transporter [Sphingobium sp. CR2-8]MEC3909493.1 MFS transporter [Sphingobium sp. CR2-8]
MTAPGTAGSSITISGTQFETLDPLPDWEEHEKPSMPGSPSTPLHSGGIRALYLTVGVLVGAAGGLSNALVSANLPQIEGALGLTPVEGTWLPAAYVMTNVSSNLILFKCRQQFGIRHFAEAGLIAYLGIALLYLMIASYEGAVLVRAVAGFAAAPMNALSVLYVLQAFPKVKLGQGLCVALGISQIWTPVAWLLSPALLDIGDWQTLYLFEFGLALCALAACVMLKLPPGIRIATFERLDFLTFALMAPAFALIGAVLAQGRTQWWTEQPWMAAALIIALGLFILAFTIEHHRRNPLVKTRWLGTAETARFAIGAFGMRMLLSEQSYAATGLLRTLGAGPDQLVFFNLVVLAGLLLGIAIAALTFGWKTKSIPFVASVVLIIIGSLIDNGATSDIRPQNMIVSQFLLAVASGLFIGPLLLFGVMKALAQGVDHIVTFAVLFAVTQSIGGLAGPALYGTFEQIRQREYSALISANLDPGDPVVAQRLSLQGRIYSTQITDPVQREALGVGQLSQIATREAHVRAFNDVFTLNAIIAAIFLAWTLYRVAVTAWSTRKQSQAAAKAASL